MTDDEKMLVGGLGAKVETVNKMGDAIRNASQSANAGARPTALPVSAKDFVKAVMDLAEECWSTLEAFADSGGASGEAIRQVTLAQRSVIDNLGEWAVHMSINEKHSN